MSLWNRHKIFEKNSIVLIIGIVVMVAIGGLVEIVPLFFLRSTIERVEGVRPYSPLELAGREIYVREGCYNCHSQMIRALRDEVERYGHYSLAAESMFDRPFQWGSKRTGPDLARVGTRYSDQWHLDHLINPRAVVPTSIMPAYPWLARTELDLGNVGRAMRVQQILGVPYSDEMIASAERDAVIQNTTDSPDAAAVQARYPKAQVRNFGSGQSTPTEADALIAYLQHLGTFVDFTRFNDRAAVR